MNILNIIWLSIVFFLPAYIANSMPVIANGFKMFPSLAFPINEKIFGHSKTYRGFFVGIIGAILTGPIQLALGFYDFYRGQNLILFILLSTFFLGFGALFGDLVKSFIKRRIGIKSGRPWIIFDQIDYVIGGIALSSIIIPQSTETIITLLILSPVFSLTANTLAYHLGFKKVWW